MKIRHHLATGFNEIPLKNVRYATEHTSVAEVIGHEGWKIIGEYAGESARQQKHRFEIIFTPEEAREHLDRLQKMVARFDDAHIQKVIDEADHIEPDGGDDG